MRPLPEAGVVVRRGLLALSVLLLLGHICVLPTHVHASGAAHGDENHSQDSAEVHAGSCEAVRSPSGGVCTGPTPVARVVVELPVGLPQQQIVARRVSPSLKAPPLFLLHASLLI